MAIRSTDGLKPGRCFKGKDGELWVLRSFFDSPSLNLVDPQTGREISAGINSLLLEDLEPATAEDIEGIVCVLVGEMTKVADTEDQAEPEAPDHGGVCSCGHSRSDHGQAVAICTVSGCDCHRFDNGEEPTTSSLRTELRDIAVRVCLALAPEVDSGSDIDWHMNEKGIDDMVRLFKEHDIDELVDLETKHRGRV